MEGYSKEDQIKAAGAVLDTLKASFGDDIEMYSCVLSYTLGVVGSQSQLPLSTILTMTQAAYQLAMEEDK